MSSPSALAVAVIGMPAVAHALTDAGYALLDPDVDAADLRAVSEMMKRAERDGRRFVVVSSYLIGNARPLVATRAARNPTVVLRGPGVKSDAEPIAMAVAELTLPATIDEIMGVLRAPAKGHPHGTVVITTDGTAAAEVDAGEPAGAEQAAPSSKPVPNKTVDMAEFDEFGDDRGADSDAEPDLVKAADPAPAQPVFADLLDFGGAPEIHLAPTGLIDLLNFTDFEHSTPEPAFVPTPMFDSLVAPPTAPTLSPAPSKPLPPSIDQAPADVDSQARTKEGAVLVCLSQITAHAVTERARRLAGGLCVSLSSAACSADEQDLRRSLVRARVNADVVVVTASIDAMLRVAFAELTFDPTVAFFGMSTTPSDDVIDALLAQLLSWRQQPDPSPRNPRPTHPSPRLDREVSLNCETDEPADRLENDGGRDSRSSDSGRGT